MGLLHLANKYSSPALEIACGKALQMTQRPTYTTVKNILAARHVKAAKAEKERSKEQHRAHGITRGAAYFRRDS